MDPIEKLDCPVLAPLNTAGMATDPMSAWPMLAWFLWIMVALQKHKKISFCSTICRTGGWSFHVAFDVKNLLTIVN
jgi:hypothetical protein